MARPVPRTMIGAALFAALLSALPLTLSLTLSLAAPDAATSLIAVAALAVAIAATLAIAATVTALPAPGLARLSLTWDRGPDELTWQSDPSAAGHIRPRAPDHS